MLPLSAPDSPRAADLFFDDFTGSSLDRSRWSVEITGQVHNHEQQAYTDSPEILRLERGDETANGVLVIQPRYHKGYVTPSGDVFDLLSGRIHTRGKFEFTHAHLAARICIPQGAGLWPAFWALGSAENWPACGEIDVMESVGEPDWVSAALHGPGYFGETPLVNKKYLPPANDATGWHVYGMRWQEDGFLFELDDQPLYRVTRPMVEFYGPWVFDQPKYLLLNLALGGVYPFKTNGIRSPYYGLPAETIRAIQNNEIQYKIDWVRVTALE